MSIAPTRPEISDVKNGKVGKCATATWVNTLWTPAEVLVALRLVAGPRSTDAPVKSEQMARELGISVKTLWGWETARRQPNSNLRTQIHRILKYSRSRP